MIDYENQYSSLMDRVSTRVRPKCCISLQNVYEFILLFNCFTNFCFFILLILVEEEVKPSYNDLKEQMPELKTLIFDMNEIMPDIKNSFVMLKNICVSDEFKHLCKH